MKEARRIAFGPLVTSDRYEDEDGSGSNNTISMMTAMIAVNSIRNTMGMFPEHTDEVERLYKRSYNSDHSVHASSFVEVDEMDNSVIAASYRDEDSPEDIRCEVIDEVEFNDRIVTEMLRESDIRIFFQQNRLLRENKHILSVVLHKYDKECCLPIVGGRSMPQMFKVQDYKKRGVTHYRAVPVTA